MRVTTIAIGIAAVILLLTGCSATKDIGNAAALVDTEAQAIQGALAAANATGEVGPKAKPFVNNALKHAQAIRDAAAKIIERLPDVEDKESPLWVFIKRLWWLLILIGIIVLSVFYAPVIRPVLLVIGAWLRIIPRPVKVDAKAEAEYIADPTPIDNSDLERIKAIELKKADPRFKVALDAELTAKGIPT